ncbi:MAG: HlyD family efflux transporter periplasmic adaptor subunit [Bacteroidia bacterium]|nr:MAG: HlyD family efflux transporter periplasmic adaptor subunit [Bacteroidia bacterium]
MVNKSIVLIFIGLMACKGKEVIDIQTTFVKLGTLTEELTEEGTVSAVNSISVSAPTISYRYGGLKITSVVEDGEEVNKGDTLLVFDPSEIKRAIINSEQQLEIAMAEFDKLKATQQSEIEDLEADLEISRISLEISKINFEQAIYESELTKKEINLRLESATIDLSRAREQIDNTQKIHNENLIQKSISIKQLNVALDDANNSMKNLFVISPAPGIAILKSNWMTDQKWGINDQPYSGTVLIDLPDLSEMMADVKINEVDVSKVIPGQIVEIRPDAYSDSIYTGVVSTVANLAQNKDAKSKIKVFPVTININGKSKNLMPGLTVSCRIIISKIQDVLYIPLEALFKDQMSEFVYVKSGAGFKRRDVKIGVTNSDFAIVTDGVSENDELALSDPYLNRNEKDNSKSD